MSFMCTVNALTYLVKLPECFLCMITDAHELPVYCQCFETPCQSTKNASLASSQLQQLAVLCSGKRKLTAKQIACT